MSCAEGSSRGKQASHGREVAIPARLLPAIGPRWRRSFNDSLRRMAKGAFTGPFPERCGMAFQRAANLASGLTGRGRSD